jgi:hypothetical protein
MDNTLTIVFAALGGRRFDPYRVHPFSLNRYETLGSCTCGGRWLLIAGVEDTFAIITTDVHVKMRRGLQQKACHLGSERICGVVD